MVLASLIASTAIAAVSLDPTAFPVFLKEGFSSILEFEENPTQVVLGDLNLFQVEKLNRSVVIKPLTAYATTNMFVYFKTIPTKLFILSASEEAEPTYYKKFTTTAPTSTEKSEPIRLVRFRKGAISKLAVFDKKKDFLTVDFVLTAGSTEKLSPSWDLIRLKAKDKILKPSKVWSERREVQKDSQVKGRLVFSRPNLAANLKDVLVVVPLKGELKPMTFALGSVSQ